MIRHIVLIRFRADLGEEAIARLLAPLAPLSARLGFTAVWGRGSSRMPRAASTAFWCLTLPFGLPVRPESERAGRMGRPTIIDVAKAAGVSKSTVSLVLQNSAAVSAKTREDVRRAMAELG
jgi:pantothenate kinase-related protein Tda10